MKSLSAHLSDDWQLEDKLQARLKHLKMKRSPYVLWLVERDLAGHAEDSPTILVSLAKTFLGPVLAEDMAAVCEGLDQRREIHFLLTRYLEERRHDRKPRVTLGKKVV